MEEDRGICQVETYREKTRYGTTRDQRSEIGFSEMKAFCGVCGEYLGEYRPNYAEKHLKEFPNHRSTLVKRLIDPLQLSDFELSAYITRFRNASSPIRNSPSNNPDTEQNHRKRR